MLTAKDTIFYSKKTLNLRGKILDISKPVVMGILNVTPDSFYDGGSYTNEISIVKRAEKLLAEGASIIDIGGYSSRPGASDIKEKEEIDRILPAVKFIMREFPDAIVSIDTFRAEVAKVAIENGALIINDISGGELDSKMFELLAEIKVPYIMMHMKGTPQTMKSFAEYDNIIVDLLDYFQKKIFHLKMLGLTDIIIDPGFGFAKNLNHNYQLLEHLSCFKTLNLPIMVGLSRKSMIYSQTRTTTEEALNGTTVLNTIAVNNGADILRVHDVKEAKEAITLYKTVYN